MADKTKREKEEERKVELRRLILANFGSQGVIADEEFFLVPTRSGLVHIHQWEEIPWSEDGGKTVKGIPIRDRIKQIIAGE